jgi:hypothetical protein
MSVYDNSTMQSNMYDGTTVATMSNAMLAGVIAGQTINLSESGVFSSANVGLRGVKVSDTISAGTDTQLSNYVLTDTTFNTTATISPATLTYLANLLSIPVGTSTAGLLSGVVDNALGQIVVNVKGQFEISGLTGTLAWTTNATSSSVAGSYYIDGSGLSANYGDYVFVQAPANAAALTVTGSSSSAASTTGTAITPVSLSQVQPAVAPGTVSNTVAVQVLPVIESPLLDRDRSKLQRSNRQTHLDIVNGGVRLANL